VGHLGSVLPVSAIEDVAEVVRFLRDPANAVKYRIDPQSLVVIGHSFGGFLAGYEAGHDRDIRAVAMISAVNLGKINANANEREARLKRWETQLHPLRGSNASELFAEAERHAKDWDYVQWVEALRGRPVLLVVADDQNHADMEALAAGIRQKGSVALEDKAVETDHSFSDHRIALQSIVVRWLEVEEARGFVLARYPPGIRCHAVRCLGIAHRTAEGFYSSRRAAMGSSRAARRAGK
jgi:pimeloyl-ACP methyl ester carboxylesterase